MRVCDAGPPPTCDFETDEDLRDGIRVGATVLVLEPNRRVYGDDGRTMARHTYRVIPITGETSRSWVVGSGRAYGGRKIPKKTLRGIYSNRAADVRSWLSDELHKLRRAADRFVEPNEPGAEGRAQRLAAAIGYDLTGTPLDPDGPHGRT